MKSKEHYRFLLVAVLMVALFGFVVVVRLNQAIEPTYAFPIAEDRS